MTATAGTAASGSSATVAVVPPKPSALTADALLDSLDVYTSSRATVAAITSNEKDNDHRSSLSSSSAQGRQATIVALPPKGGDTSTSNKSMTATSTAASTGLDPIEFLNRHYTTESMLVAQLPSLRTATSDRMERLDERISNALQRQSETADATRRHVYEAKNSIISLEKRIRLVQEKASQSEKAVLQITKEMKRLDCAKRHLQRTITTLKRLHMLVHAVEQLRLACLLKPFPDYKSASNLIDATRLLLKHFDAYTNKVEPMRLIGEKVYDIQNELRTGLTRGFRVVGFGLVKALELEEGKTNKSANNNTNNNSNSAGGNLLPSALNADNNPPSEQVAPSMPIMTPDVLADSTLLLDALGMDTRTEFVNGLCNDHLLPYKQLFDPKPTSRQQSNVSANSFKIDTSTDSGGISDGDKPPYSLEQIDRRFAWYRRLFRDIFEEKFHKVFPVYWNIQYTLTKHFLEQTKEHLLGLLGGSTKDRDADNATVLLKALQKTILFEKEMTNWLQRDYGTVFLAAGVSATGDTAAGGISGSSAADEATQSGAAVRGENGEVLEFDETGRAVAANSAEGIRIKYERQRREKKKKEQQSQQQAHQEDSTATALDEGRASDDQVPVEPLLGIASCAYDDYMKPYIALEEQNMNEQLEESNADSAVDTRGELPVFTSSTALFVYIKGSITRCTALTKGKAFHLLYNSFQEALVKYANVLSGKLPKETSAAAAVVGGISSALATRSTSSSNTIIKIPPGGEVTVCHVISTCEYCVDTVEALEDLIRDTIDDEFKDMIDMSEQQDSFHDVTAKSIRVLVAGLSNRVDNGFKLMSEIKWSTFDMVGDESSYVRLMHKEVQPFTASVRTLMPSSYFRSFCDKFATSFTTTYYDNLIKQKRISEGGAQQLLLDVNNLKSLILKLPVMEKANASSSSGGGKNKGAVGTIAPAMYTKMVTKQFKKIEILLKLVSTPNDLLIDVFKVHWVGGSALDLQTIMTLKGMKRNEQAGMLEKFGLDRATALRGATQGVSGASLMAERAHAITEKSLGSGAVAQVNRDLNQMRQKVDDFRRAFR